MKFWRRLKSAWLYCRFAPYVEAADAEGFWTEEDAKWLENVFNSYHGRKLRVRLTNFTIQAACNAVNSQGDYARQTGVAAGIAIGIGAIEEHFPRGTANSAEPELSDDMTAIDALAQAEAV